MTKKEAKQKIADLVDHFKDNFDSYMAKTGDEGERQIEEYLITPFFQALGWFDNPPGTPIELRDVKFQASISLKRGLDRGGKGKKKVDYAFRINGVNQFFIEAKIPSRDLKPKAGGKISQDTIESIWQAKTYGWSKDVPIVLLTDFEEFRVFNTIKKPNKKRYFEQVIEELDIQYTDYVDKFDLIWDTFSKEAVAAGSLEKYQESSGAITRQTIDEALLETIDSWRNKLAENIIYNIKRAEGEFPASSDLTNIVQTIIDRILFIRFLEDNGIEPQLILKKYLDPEYNSKQIYSEIVRDFESLAPYYNGSIFGTNYKLPHPADKVVISNVTIKAILNDLYDDSPYDFSVIPIEIIGRIYERFLGKVISVTEKGGYSIDLKEDIRKADGIFYTPKFIVDFIVEETVGRLIAGKKPSEIAKIRVLDPACGSGSFLLGAFERIVREYERFFFSEFKKGNKTRQEKDWILVKDQDEDVIKITVEKKKEILANNIFGVDLDRQAVEVAQMSLYLKLLEDENFEVKQPTLQGMKTTVLPNLTKNIISGNSIIGKNIGFLPSEQIVKINPKDYEEMFDFFPTEKFDAVIGNPPYLNIDDTWGKKDVRLQYIKENYSDVYNDKTDLLFYFLYKSIKLSAKYTGLIVSRAFLEAYKANKLRKWLSQNTQVEKLIDFRNYYVFKGVGITTCILILNNSKTVKEAAIYKKNELKVTLNNLNTQLKQDKYFDSLTYPTKSLGESSWSFSEKNAQTIIDKIDLNCTALGEILLIGQGMQTGRNNVFGTIDEDMKKKLRIPENLYYVRARNSDIDKYVIQHSGEYLLYLENVKSFNDLPAKIQDHLNSHKTELQKRAAYKRGNCDWWRYTWPLHREHFNKNKLYCPYLASSNRFALDEKQVYLGLTDTTVLYDNDQAEDLKYFMGLLNSKLLTFRFRAIGKLKSNNIYEYFWNSISKIPIKRLDLGNKDDASKHKSMVDMVSRQIEYRNNIKNKKVSISETQVLEEQSAALEDAINKLTYEIYDMTNEEIAFIEATFTNQENG